ncbi:MAG: bacillithiol biosynthesis cysteine-adding enzyme BshC, partial [Flavobacteriaceae bacterium]|nr:bacillithiol biosynthesis cysteine-adding enzyme BshC [Flavobacteriaceae bacterium]
MDIDCIPFSKTGYFSQLIIDYLDQKDHLKPFYNSYPELASFGSQLQRKSDFFTEEARLTLVRTLQQQYEATPLSPASSRHISMLESSNTFTVVTGHQLNLFTGPLYFLYKIISTINLCDELKNVYPERNFVPVYWMATEDHDFDEINYFNFRGKKIQWNKDASGAVGRLDNQGLQAVFDSFKLELGAGENADRLKDLFRKAYLKHLNLASATRYLVNELFGDYGLVILDGDDVQLKKQFVPYMKKDLEQQLGFKAVTQTIKELEKIPQKYGIQVNPREVNYFYLKDGIRERLEYQDGHYYVLDTDIKFTGEELLKELDQYPERFSPNVMTRPLYQEVVLPNLCYIGGGGELAYWLELKSFFEQAEVPFPILQLRNSVLMISDKQAGKAERLKVKATDLFLKQSSLINKKIREISNIDIDFGPQREQLVQQFSGMYELAEKTDKSFLGAVKAQEVKQLKGLDNLEKRLLKAQKRKLSDQVSRL